MKKIIFTLLAGMLALSSFANGPFSKKISDETKKFIESHYGRVKHLELLNLGSGMSEIYFISNNTEYIIHLSAEGKLLQEEKEITHYQLPIQLQEKVADNAVTYASEITDTKGEKFYSIETEQNGAYKEYVYDLAGRIVPKGACNLINCCVAETENHLLM